MWHRRQQINVTIVKAQATEINTARHGHRDQHFTAL